MRVLYVAPRYHTNQIPVMKGWQAGGHEVLFISQFAGTPEDYTVLKPIILGYSRIFECFMKGYACLLCRGQKSLKKEFDLRTKIGFPPVTKAETYIRKFQPELVIVRERSVYNIPFWLACRKKKIPCILYNQSPLWDRRDRDRGLGRRLFLKLLPRVRMTPVMGQKAPGKEMTPHSVFVPFVMEPRVAPEEKPHYTDGRIQILCVGRYEERKNLFLLLDAFGGLSKEYSLHLTIVGEALDESKIDYYERLRRKVSESGLDQAVTLHRNFNREQMYEEYRGADLFVLPSTRERASIAQLEAMSCSLPVICSDTNGSACYVEDGRNGRLFRDGDEKDLKNVMETLVRDREGLLRMGSESFRLTKENYSFDSYYEAIMKCRAEAARLTGE